MPSKLVRIKAKITLSKKHFWNSTNKKMFIPKQIFRFLQSQSNMNIWIELASNTQTHIKIISFYFRITRNASNRNAFLIKSIYNYWLQISLVIENWIACFTFLNRFTIYVHKILDNRIWNVFTFEFILSLIFRFTSGKRQSLGKCFCDCPIDIVKTQAN